MWAYIISREFLTRLRIANMNFSNIFFASACVLLNTGFNLIYWHRISRNFKYPDHRELLMLSPLLKGDTILCLTCIFENLPWISPPQSFYPLFISIIRVPLLCPQSILYISLQLHLFYCFIIMSFSSIFFKLNFVLLEVILYIPSSNTEEKSHQVELNRQDNFIQNYCNRGQGYCKRGERVNSTSLQGKVGYFFKHWSELVGKLWMISGRSSVTVIRPLFNWHWCLQS